ncbi:hypothetical protein HD597_006723 [Nonomuraea thailandensis]|uniref:Uncharacterized protein n=1 Tax=Nonomuraea thailandensis TaxID=1188745 RepID=A0A9X2GRS4_9ACTN|nr:hypothetical protein [Nonomuraea thailandensis]
MYRWEPHIPRGSLLCVVESSCCEEFILCSEDSQFFVRRRAANGGHEQTARGPYARAAKAWIELSSGHQHAAKVAS